MDTIGNPNPSSLNESDKAAVREFERRLRQKIMAKLDLQAMGLSSSGEGVAWPEILNEDGSPAQENNALSDRLQQELEALFNATLADENITLSPRLRQELLDNLASDLLLLGPLEPLLADETINEIMIDGYNKVYVERNQEEFDDVPSRFRDDEHLLQIIRRLAANVGRRVDESHPILDMPLPDGSRINVVIPPIALNGPTLTIRKFSPDPLTVEDLFHYGSWNEDMVEFLRACVQGRLNIVVSGGTGSGKTTILNVLAGMIPDKERIIKIQSESDELILRQKYVVALESRPPNLEGKGEVTVRDLVANAVKMRPDRIITGEVRRGEVLDLLDAMNTGHDGCMFTVHATAPHDALARLELMGTSANPSIPLLNVRHAMASALNLVVQQDRLRDGTRKIVKISEVEGMQGDVIVLSDIFEFRQTGTTAGKINGYFTATGRIPKFLSHLSAARIDLPLSFFTPR